MKKAKGIKCWVRLCNTFNADHDGFVYKLEKDARVGQYPCCKVFHAFITPLPEKSKKIK